MGSNRLKLSEDKTGMKIKKITKKQLKELWEWESGG